MANKTKILIVDDEPDFREAFVRTLEAKAFQVMTASSKAQAQELMGLEPDIVVLGTLTPAGQAFALHQWLKQHPSHRETPLMVIDSPYEERFNKGWRKFEGMQLGSEDYVTKPVE